MQLDLWCDYSAFYDWREGLEWGEDEPAIN